MYLHTLTLDYFPIFFLSFIEHKFKIKLVFPRKKIKSVFIIFFFTFRLLPTFFQHRSHKTDFSFCYIYFLRQMISFFLLCYAFIIFFTDVILPFIILFSKISTAGKVLCELRKYCKMPKRLEKTKFFQMHGTKLFECENSQSINVICMRLLHLHKKKKWKVKFLICINGKKENFPAGSDGRNFLTPPVYG